MAGTFSPPERENHSGAVQGTGMEKSTGAAFPPPPEWVFIVKPAPAANPIFPQAPAGGLRVRALGGESRIGWFRECTGHWPHGHDLTNSIVRHVQLNFSY
jgi:hypothetical protein